MSLDWATLRALAETEDEIGVLSVYLHRDPRSRADTTARPPWELRLRQRLDAAHDRIRDEWPRTHQKAFADRLAQLAPELDRLRDPTGSGRGVALFAGIAAPTITSVAVQVPLVDEVVVEPRPYLRPLLTAWSAAGPAGAVSVSADEIKLVDLRFGQTELVGAIPVLYESEVTRELRGPAPAHPGLAQHSANQRDLYERREDDKLLRFLRTVGPQISAHVDERGWGYLALTGDAPLVQAVRDGLPPQLPAAVVTLDHPVTWLSAPKLAAAVAPAVDEARQRRHRELAEQARQHAMAANTGAVGLGETLGALQEGRVAHLLLAADGQWFGSASPAGFLVPEGELAPGVEPQSLRPEPRLAQRMIELAFQQAAQITVLSPQEAQPLAEADGIGAILRW